MDKYRSRTVDKYKYFYEKNTDVKTRSSPVLLQPRVLPMCPVAPRGDGTAGYPKGRSESETVFESSFSFLSSGTGSVLGKDFRIGYTLYLLIIEANLHIVTILRALN